MGNGLFNHILGVEYAYIDEGLDVLQIYIERAVKEQLIIPADIQ
jgi:hypothetical protein